MDKFWFLLMQLNALNVKRFRNGQHVAYSSVIENYEEGLEYAR